MRGKDKEKVRKFECENIEESPGSSAQESRSTGHIVIDGLRARSMVE